MKILSAIITVFFIVACGQKEKDVEIVKVPYQKEEPQKQSDQSGLAISQIKKSCVGCHSTQAPVMNSDEGILALKGQICAVINAGSMPPSGPLDAKKSANILVGFQCG